MGVYTSEGLHCVQLGDTICTRFNPLVVPNNSEANELEVALQVSVVGPAWWRLRESVNYLCCKPADKANEPRNPGDQGKLEAGVRGSPFHLLCICLATPTTTILCFVHSLHENSDSLYESSPMRLDDKAHSETNLLPLSPFPPFTLFAPPSFVPFTAREPGRSDPPGGLEVYLYAAPVRSYAGGTGDR